MGAQSAQGDFLLMQHGPVGKGRAGSGFQWNIRNLPAGIAMKMGMIAEVRTETTGRPVQIHLSHQSDLHQGFETIIDRRQGNLRHPFLGSGKDLLHRGMIAPFKEHIIDLAPLPRQAQSRPFLCTGGRAEVGKMGGSGHEAENDWPAPLRLGTGNQGYFSPAQIQASPAASGSSATVAMECPPRRQPQRPANDLQCPFLFPRCPGLAHWSWKTGR